MSGQRRNAARVGAILIAGALATGLAVDVGHAAAAGPSTGGSTQPVAGKGGDVGPKSPVARRPSGRGTHVALG